MRSFASPATEGVDSSVSGVHRTETAVPGEYLTLVASDARSLLGALLANLEWMKSSVEPTAPLGLVDAVADMEICCRRLHSVLERVLIGARGGGLTLQRSAVTLGSVVAGALAQVSPMAAAKRVRVRMGAETDVVAMLDRTMLTCGLAGLMGQIISSCDPDSEVVALYQPGQGDVSITFLCTPATGSCGVPIETDHDVAFCRVVVEWHGGHLTRDDDTASYRVVLPWIEVR